MVKQRVFQLMTSKRWWCSGQSLVYLELACWFIFARRQRCWAGPCCLRAPASLSGADGAEEDLSTNGLCLAHSYFLLFFQTSKMGKSRLQSLNLTDQVNQDNQLGHNNLRANKLFFLFFVMRLLCNTTTKALIILLVFYFASFSTVFFIFLFSVFFIKSMNLFQFSRTFLKSVISFQFFANCLVNVF